MKSIYEELGDIQLKLLHIGIFEGFCASVSDLPFQSKAVSEHIEKQAAAAAAQPAELAVAVPPAVTGASPALREEVKRYDDVGEQAKQKKGWQLALRIVCSSLTRRLAVGMEWTLRHIETEHRLCQTEMKTAMGTFEKIVEGYAHRSYNTYVGQIFRELENIHLVTRMEFDLDPVDLDEDAVELIEDKIVAKSLVDIVREVSIHELRHMRACDGGRAGYLLRVPLSAPRCSSRFPVLDQNFVVELARSRESSFDRPIFGSYLKDMMWPMNSWIREIFVSIEECEFDHLPSDVKQELKKILVSMMNGSVINEEAFRLLNASARGASSGFLGAHIGTTA